MPIFGGFSKCYKLLRAGYNRICHPIKGTYVKNHGQIRNMVLNYQDYKTNKNVGSYLLRDISYCHKMNFFEVVDEKELLTNTIKMKMLS